MSGMASGASFSVRALLARPSEIFSGRPPLQVHTKLRQARSTRSGLKLKNGAESPCFETICFVE